MEPTTYKGHILNCIPSREPERDWPLAASPTMAKWSGADLPNECVWRTSPILDQGETGACVGYSLAAIYAERAREEFSPAWFWAAAKETDQWTSYPTTPCAMAGTSLKAALDVARKFGALTLDDMPPGKLFAGTEEEMFASAAQWRIEGYHTMRDVLGRMNESAFRSALALIGPLHVASMIDEAFCECKGELETYHADEQVGGHAFAIDGYFANGKFGVRNSWGPKWGEGGFSSATWEWVKAAISEAYAVQF